MSGSKSTPGETVDGVGVLNHQRAVDIARDTEGPLDPAVEAYLESALSAIWSQIEREPDSYILSKDEFAVFNFYISRYADNENARKAIERYWQS